MTVADAMKLLNLKKKRDLAPILGQGIGRIDSLNPNSNLSKGSTIIVGQKKEINDLEAILHSLGYGVARKCDNCGDVFETVRVREDGDNEVFCQKCFEKLEVETWIAIDESWFDDEQPRGAKLEDGDYIILGDERIHLKDIPENKYKIYKNIPKDDGSLFT